MVQDFTSLKPVDTEHIMEIPVAEKEVKYRHMQKWIKETLDLIETVDADKYSGGIAYLLLALAYRIDFLLVPEGRLLLDLEKIVDIYFRKDDRTVSEKNAEMSSISYRRAPKKKYIRISSAPSLPFLSLHHKRIRPLQMLFTMPIKTLAGIKTISTLILPPRSVSMVLLTANTPIAYHGPLQSCSSYL